MNDMQDEMMEIIFQKNIEEVTKDIFLMEKSMIMEFLVLTITELRKEKDYTPEMILDSALKHLERIAKAFKKLEELK